MMSWLVQSLFFECAESVAFCTAGGACGDQSNSPLTVGVRHGRDDELTEVADGVGPDFSILSTIVDPVECRLVENTDRISEVDPMLSHVRLILGIVPFKSGRKTTRGWIHDRFRAGVGLNDFISSAV